MYLDQAVITYVNIPNTEFELLLLECGQTLYDSGRHLVLPGLLLYSTSDTQNLNFPPKSLLTL